MALADGLTQSDIPHSSGIVAGGDLQQRGEIKSGQLALQLLVLAFQKLHLLMHEIAVGMGQLQQLLGSVAAVVATIGLNKPTFEAAAQRLLAALHQRLIQPVA